MMLQGFTPGLPINYSGYRLRPQGIHVLGREDTVEADIYYACRILIYYYIINLGQYRKSDPTISIWFYA